MTRIGFIQVEVLIEADQDMVSRVGKAAAKAVLKCLTGDKLVSGSDLVGGQYSAEVVDAKFTKTKVGGYGIHLPGPEEYFRDHPPLDPANNPFKPGDTFGRMDSDAVFKVVEVIGDNVELDDGQLVLAIALMAAPWRSLTTAEGSEEVIEPRPNCLGLSVCGSGCDCCPANTDNPWPPRKPKEVEN